MVKLNLATSDLAEKFGLGEHGPSVEVSGIQIASSQCISGDLFVAVQGQNRHGIEYLGDAAARGAVAVLTDESYSPQIGMTHLTHPNPREIAGEIAAELYGTRSLGLMVLGVTGTNGKTSTATYIQQLLEGAGIACGLSASTNRIVGDQVLSSALTTPEVTELHRMLAQMQQAGQSHVSIEVSAQALVRNRVDGLFFDVVGFTNFSRDHLDDFETMENYFAAKKLLFRPQIANKGVVLVEDEVSAKFAQESQIPVVTIGDSGDYQFRYSDSVLSISGKSSLEFPFTGGALMAKNLALALVMILESGLSPAKIMQAQSKAELSVPGRLERVSNNTPAVFVDYAHTPAGVQSAIAELKTRYEELTVVLGASGNRDVGKRPEMAAAASVADLLVITDQHPRNEDPAAIRKTLIDTAEQLVKADRLFEIADPAEAIKFAIANTPSDSAVLWCGPGHLSYREVAGVKVPFDARAIAKAAVEA